MSIKACLLCRNNRESEVALQVTYSFRVVSKYVLEYVAGQDAPLSLRDVLEAPFIHGGRGLPIVPQGFPFVFAPQALIQVAYTYYLALPFLIWKSATLALLPFTGPGSLWGLPLLLIQSSLCSYCRVPVLFLSLSGSLLGPIRGSLE